MSLSSFCLLPVNICRITRINLYRGKFSKRSISVVDYISKNIGFFLSSISFQIKFHNIPCRTNSVGGLNSVHGSLVVHPCYARIQKKYIFSKIIYYFRSYLRLCGPCADVPPVGSCRCNIRQWTIICKIIRVYNMALLKTVFLKHPKMYLFFF